MSASRPSRGVCIGRPFVVSFTAGDGHQVNDSFTQAADNRFRALYSQGRYAEAATVGERVLKLAEQAHGLNDPATAAALNNLAVVYGAQGRYEEAVKAYGRAHWHDPDGLAIAATCGRN